MKIKKSFYLPLFVLAIGFTACKKDKANPVTRPVSFTSTTYQFLGTYDDAGRPNYLEPKDSISADLLSFINQNLPNKDLRTTNPDLLKSTAIADIVITQSSDVFITFVTQGYVDKPNALGFYTYPTAQPPVAAKDIKTITYIFPSAGSGSTLQAGDKVKLGRFEPGTSIGFVLLQGAWNATTKKPNNNAVHFTSNDVLNPEVDTSLKKHAVLINYAPENKMLIGFEDLDRTSPAADHDFNDLVIYATVRQ